MAAYPRGTRSLTNERHINATTLSLSEIFVQNGLAQSSMRDIFEIFLKIDDVSKDTWDSESKNPASQEKIAEQLAASLALCRLKSLPVPLAEIDGLFIFLQNQYRALSNSTYEMINLRDYSNPGVFFNVAEFLANLSREISFKRGSSVYQELNYTWSPDITKHIHISRPTTAFQTDVNYSYQVDRTVRRTKVEQRLQSDIYYNYNVTKVAAEPVYTLGNPDFYNKGRIGLYKDGTLISTLQLLPTPLAHAYNLLSVTPGPNESYFLNNPGAHSNSHPGGSGSGSSDGVLQTLSIDTGNASANLGKVTAYITGGIAITTPQATTDIHYTKTEVDALLNAITSQHAMDVSISNGLHTLRAQQIAALDARIAALEAIPRLTMKFQGGSDLPVDQIQLKNGHFSGTAHYTGVNILYLQTAGPSDNNPY